MKAYEEEALPEKFNLSVWGRVLRYALSSWPLMLALAGTLLFTTFYDSSFVPVMNAGAIASAEKSSLAGGVFSVEIPVEFLFGINVTFDFLGYSITLVAMLLIRAVMIFFTFFLTNYIGMKVMVALRRDCFKKIQELSFSYFDKVTSGWLVARMNNDTSSLGDVLSWGVIQIVWALGNLGFTVATMFSVNYIYALIVFASVPLMVLILPFFQKIQLKRHRTARNAYSHYVGWLAESIEGAKTIKTLGIEEEAGKEALDVTEDIRRKRFKAMRMDAFFQPFVSFLGSAVTAALMFYGLFYDRRDTATVISTLILFISFSSNIFSPLQSLSEIFGEFLSTQAGAEKIMQILDAKVDITDKREVIEKYGTLFEEKDIARDEPLKGDIEYRNVSFAYGDGPEVIHPLCLTIKEGTSLAIVGETGSGKTTLVNLLCRFYEPKEGKILIGGEDYREKSLGWLRNHIGYVQQSPFVFSDTFFRNIAYGKLTATLEEVRHAAKIVGIDDFVMKQKDGYGTYLEDGGGTLSQGQKQLISFARALIRNPEILILDEATSSIDTETEALVQKATAELLKGRTSIVIAHRLSTIVHCDRILVMDHGYIVEDGNHKSLMERKGRYYELYTNQFKNLDISSQLELSENG